MTAVSESIHMRLEALCASMQRHGVSVVDLDKLRMFVNVMLDDTEKRLSKVVPSSATPTQPDTPRSITQRLRALADDDPDSSSER
jgi:hypothetical protein